MFQQLCWLWELSLIWMGSGFALFKSSYLLISSQFAWYTYVTVIANFSLFLSIYLARVRGRPLSKQSSRFWECICILSPVTVGLTVASAVQIYNHVHDTGCTVTGKNLHLTETWGISLSMFLGIDLEVMLVSIFLCIYFCFIHQRIWNRQSTVLLRNSFIHIAINASVTGLDPFVWDTMSTYGLPSIQENIWTLQLLTFL